MKKTLIIIGIVLAVIAVGLAIFNKYTRSHSPEAQAVYQEGDLKIEIHYCQPSLKNRVIFGEESAKALQPYGTYWRMGANAATTFETNSDIVFNDKELKAGKYAIYAIPGKDTWAIAINSEWDRWGAMAPDEKNDLFRTQVPAGVLPEPREMFEISFSQPDSLGNANLNLEWEKVKIQVPFHKK